MAEELEKESLEPAILVIFGITGDLAKRKLLPAIYHLLKDDLLHPNTQIIGLSRRHINKTDILKEVEVCILEEDSVCDPRVLHNFQSRLSMVQLDPVEPDHYKQLQDKLNEIEAEQGMCMNRLFYLAIPPQVYGPVIRNMGTNHLQDGCPHNKGESRILVEKPFGYDLVSAGHLINETTEFFREEQIFRIDHYLAKETAQNILTFRKRNPAFSAIWGKDHIESIEVLAYEKIGIEGRGEFYDNIGALRDIVQSHLLQLLTLTTMEVPEDIHNVRSLHSAKHELLSSIKPVDMSKSSVVRGQYIGYREEAQNPTSFTETYVALTLDIDNPRWQGVLIRLATGKALNAKHTTIRVKFGDDGGPSNALTFRIQPNEGIDIDLVVKRPGFKTTLEKVKMDFSYHGVFGDQIHPDAYERVLVDAFRGDRSLCATGDEVLLSWRILQPILDAWNVSEDDLEFYKPGSEGPET